MRTVLWFAGSLILFALTAAVHVLVPILAPPGISWGQERDFDAKRELESGWLFAEWDDRTRPLIIVLGLIGGLLLLKLIIYLVSRLLRFLTDWIHFARFTRKSRRLGTEEANFAGPTANSQLHGSGDTDGAEQRNGHFALQDNLAELEDCRDQERATREDAEKEISRLKEGLEIREAEWVSARAGLEGRVSELAARGDGLRRESESFQAE